MILRAASLVLFTALLSGCGQKGPLVVVAEPAPQVQAPPTPQDQRPPQPSPSR